MTALSAIGTSFTALSLRGMKTVVANSTFSRVDYSTSCAPVVLARKCRNSGESSRLSASRRAPKRRREYIGSRIVYRAVCRKRERVNYSHFLWRKTLLWSVISGQARASALYAFHKLRRGIIACTRRRMFKPMQQSQLVDPALEVRRKASTLRDIAPNGLLSAMTYVPAALKVCTAQHVGVHVYSPMEQ